MTRIKKEKEPNQFETVGNNQEERNAAIIEEAKAAIKEKRTVDVTEAFSNAKYSIGNARKIMDGKSGGAFYVSYLQDTGSKTGNLQLVIEYPNGQIKRVFLAKNCFKVLEGEDDGIAKIEVNGKEVIPRISESKNNGDFRVLEKYETPEMPIPSQVLWKAIVEHYKEIPVQLVYKSEDFEGLYWRLKEIADAECEKDIGSDRQNAVRFLVTKKEMEEVALENGWTLPQLRAELNLRGLLVKDRPYRKDGTNQVNSYQLTKKISGKNERFYAIRKFIDVPIKSDDRPPMIENTEQIYETDSEKEKRLLKEKCSELEKKLIEKDKEIQELYLNRIDDATPQEILEKCV